MEINIDATNAIMGRLSSYAAKQAMLGHTVNIFNCEKAVISGSKEVIREKYYYRIFKTGRPTRGPFISRMPDRFLRRSLRGMLQHKDGRGRAAYERIMCYLSVPEQFKDKKLVKVAKEARELPRWKYTSLGDLCVSIGGRTQ